MPIALALEEWREHRDIALSVTSALTQVRLEIERTSELAEAAAPRHAAVATAYREALDWLRRQGGL